MAKEKYIQIAKECDGRIQELGIVIRANRIVKYRPYVIKARCFFMPYEGVVNRLYEIPKKTR
jgi:hypothetical protein